MGDQHDGALEVAEVGPEEGPDVDARAGVERGHRLVEQQHPRLGGQRAGQCHPLRLTAGELGRATTREVGEPESLEPLRGRCPGAGAGQPGRLRREGDVVAHVEVREEPVVLEDDPGRALVRAQVDLLVGPDLAADEEPARRQRLEAGDRAQEGALAGAVGPEHGEHLARCDVEGDGELELAATDTTVEGQAAGTVVLSPGRAH